MKLVLVVVVLSLVVETQACAGHKRNVTIEVSIVTDFALFQKWKTFYGGDFREAIKGIYYMYANVFKTVRDRFWSVEMEGVRFDLRFANTHVAYLADQAKFIEETVGVKTGDGAIDEKKALAALKEFVSDGANMFNSSDVNVLVTGYKLPGGLEKFSDGTLIDRDSVNMVITEVGLHRTADTLTRELSQALGGFSDVIYESNKDKFIMTVDRKENSFEHIDNLDKFSNETQKAFEETFKTKVYPWDKKKAVESKFDVDWCARTHPLGQTYPAHRQCKFMYGQESSDCTDDGSLLLDICIRLGCTDPLNKGQCTFVGDQRAYDRTSCGEGKWCLKGKCVDDSKAPPNQLYDGYEKYL